MPYLGEGRGSYGELWIKTADGWRTSKTINIRNSNVPSQNQNKSNDTGESAANKQMQKSQGFLWNTKAPYIVLPGCSKRGPSFYFVSQRGSKQNGNYSTVGGAFQALDFCSAVRDSRKFLYVCRLLEILIRSDHMAPEGGMARKQINNTLNEIVFTALDTELNIHIARHLINLSREHIAREKLKYLSLRQKYDKRDEELTELQGKLKRFKIAKLRKGVAKSSTNIIDLPEECLRMIVACFSDHRDLCRLSKVNRHFRELCDEQLIWKRLCHFHFSKHQLDKAKYENKVVWKNFYRKIIRQTTMRDAFADFLQFCSHCHCLFWKRNSHPCTYDSSKRSEHKPPVFIPVTPEGFIHLIET